jgi:hypothetical protein
MRETTVYIHTIQDLTSHISDGHHCELRIVFKRKSTLYFPSVCQSLQLPPSLYEDLEQLPRYNKAKRYTDSRCIQREPRKYHISVETIPFHQSSLHFIATHATYFCTWHSRFYTSESFPKTILSCPTRCRSIQNVAKRIYAL